MKSFLCFAALLLFVPLATAADLKIDLVSARDYKLSTNQFQDMQAYEPNCLGVFRDALNAYVSQLGYNTLSVNNQALILKQARLVAVEDQTQGSLAIGRIAKFQIPLVSGGTAFVIAKTRGDLFCEHEVVEDLVGGFLNFKY